MLKAAEFPDGGVHGGHRVVVWNQGRAGYVLSSHAIDNGPRTQNEQRTDLLGCGNRDERLRGVELQVTVLVAANRTERAASSHASESWVVGGYRYEAAVLAYLVRRTRDSYAAVVLTAVSG